MAGSSGRSASQGEKGSFTWRVTSVSEQTEEKLLSDTFTVGGVSWRLRLHPIKGGSHLTLSLWLSDDRPYGWSCPASWKLVLKSQTDDKYNVVQEFSSVFNSLAPCWTPCLKVRSQLGWSLQNK
jgi:hypothetical protein